jgi:hypothetical protein
MSKREDILVALLAVLQAVDPAVARNVALAPEGAFATQRDGDCDLVEEFFGGAGSIYEFTMTPTLIVVVVGEDIDAALTARVDAFVAALEAVDDLGGLITAIRPQPAEFAPEELFGVEDRMGATVAVEIDFWSAHSAG